MRPVDIVAVVAPGARSEYRAAFEAGDALFVKYGLTTRLRIGHFLAQCLAETGGLSITRENMNYSAQRMVEIFGYPRSSAAVSPGEAARLAHHPEAIAERVYGLGSPKLARDLGNTQPGDGFRYRGGGIFQTTGRYNYRIMGKLCGIDFEGHPEWVLSAEHALKPALGEWDRGKLNNYADRNDILSVSRVINVGNAQTSKIPNGMADRRIWFSRVWRRIANETITFDATPAGPVPPPAALPVAPIEPPAPVPLVIAAPPQLSVWAWIAQFFGNHEVG